MKKAFLFLMALIIGTALAIAPVGNASAHRYHHHYRHHHYHHYHHHHYHHHYHR